MIIWATRLPLSAECKPSGVLRVRSVVLRIQLFLRIVRLVVVERLFRFQMMVLFDGLR
jgi:hypothetical protein